MNLMILGSLCWDSKIILVVIGIFEVELCENGDDTDLEFMHVNQRPIC